MSWGEALRLTDRLLRDLSSDVAAAVRGAAHPVSREWELLHVIASNDFGVATAKKGKSRLYEVAPHPYATRKIGGKSARPVADFDRLIAEHRRG